MTEEQKLFEKLICSKCEDEQTKNYIHCKNCQIKGFKLGKAGATEATKELQEEIKGQKEYIKYLKRQRQGGIQKQYNKVKKVKELEAQIEKMKCCTNCRYCIKDWGEVNPNGRHCKKCKKQSEWKLRR